MQISTKTSIAIHCLIFIYKAKKQNVKVTSNLLSESTGINPVIIRNILSALKKANIINTQLGSGGTELVKDINDISLYEIFNTIEPDGLDSLIGIHSCSNRKCVLAKQIKNILDKPYQKIKRAIVDTMKSITLKQMIDDYKE